MAELNEKIKKITLLNTKKEMLEAYNALVKQLSKKEESELPPEELKEKKRKEEIMKEVDTLNSADVIKSIAALKAEIGNLLATISNKMEEEVNKYVKIKEAILLKEKELQEIYEIEKNAFTLSALIELQSQKRIEFENEMKQKREVFELEMKESKARFEEEKKLQEAKIKEEIENEEKRRKREKEEFEYSFKRQQQIEKDKFEDEKSKLKKQLQEERESFERELSQREAKISQREEELVNLRNSVSSFPKEMESAVSKAIKETTEKLNSERKNAEEFQKKIFEGERNVLKTKIEALEKRVQEQNEEITRLSRYLDEAYQKIQNIAVKSISEKGVQAIVEKSEK